MITSGGEWISSVELENTIMGRPQVAEAADELRARFLENCREEIPRWWVPKNWAFVDQVPRTSAGKFDKKVLRAQ